MSNSFLFAFTVTALLTAGAVDFVNQTKVTGGIGVKEYLAALPDRLGGKASGAAPQAVAEIPAGATVDNEALRQQMAVAANQIAAAAAAAQAGQPANPEAATGAASFLRALLKGMGKGQAAPAAEEPIRPAGAEAAIKPNVAGFGTCAGNGLGKRCKVGG